MSAREPSAGDALVPAEPADVAPVASPVRSPSRALVPDGAIVDRGSSLPRTTAFSLVASALINVGFFGLIISKTVPEPIAVGVMFSLLGALGLSGLHNLWKRWRNDRRLGEAPPFLGLEDGRGQPVRLIGVVQKQPRLLLTPKGHPAVLARYQGCRGSARGPGWSNLWQWELHAVDFCVRADDGRELWVDVRGIILLPHPPTTERQALGQRRVLYRQPNGERWRSLSWIYDEEVIAPGDRIEVAGTLDLVPHPGASAGSDRGPRLRPVLRGTPEAPVQVRRHFLGLPELPLIPPAGYDQLTWVAVMPTYAALLRGVSPMNAKMPALRKSFEAAGFTDVKTVRSSGNVLFGARAASDSALERRAEAAMKEHLGRTFLTIVRPVASLRAIVKADPFRSFRLAPGSKRVVTFLRDRPRAKLTLPLEVDRARILAIEGREVFTAYLPSPRGAVFMSLIEKTFGQAVTTRTWDTVQKLAA